MRLGTRISDTAEDKQEKLKYSVIYIPFCFYLIIALLFKLLPP